MEDISLLSGVLKTCDISFKFNDLVKI